MPTPFKIPLSLVAATLAVGVGALAQSPPKTSSPSLPAEVAAYYEDLRFAVAFSTPEERQRLVGGAASTPTPRLHEVAARMQSASLRELDAAQGTPQTVTLGAYVPPFVLTPTEADETGPDQLVVRVLAAPLPPGVNRSLIENYPDADSPGAQGETSDPTFVEEHVWVEVAGRWYRQGPLLR